MLIGILNDMAHEMLCERLSEELIDATNDYREMEDLYYEIANRMVFESKEAIKEVMEREFLVGEKELANRLNEITSR